MLILSVRGVTSALDISSQHPNQNKRRYLLNRVSETKHKVRSCWPCQGCGVPKHVGCDVDVVFWMGIMTSHAQWECSSNDNTRHNIETWVPYPLATLCRSSSSMPSNFCCSASRSTSGSCNLLAWSLPVFSDFVRPAFCRSSSQADRVAMLRTCSARISSQRLLRWEDCEVPKEHR